MSSYPTAMKTGDWFLLKIVLQCAWCLFDSNEIFSYMAKVEMDFVCFLFVTMSLGVGLNSWRCARNREAAENFKICWWNSSSKPATISHCTFRYYLVYWMICFWRLFLHLYSFFIIFFHYFTCSYQCRLQLSIMLVVILCFLVMLNSLIVVEYAAFWW